MRENDVKAWSNSHTSILRRATRDRREATRGWCATLPLFPNFRKFLFRRYTAGLCFTLKKKTEQTRIECIELIQHLLVHLKHPPRHAKIYKWGAIRTISRWNTASFRFRQLIAGTTAPQKTFANKSRAERISQKKNGGSVKKENRIFHKNDRTKNYKIYTKKFHPSRRKFFSHKYMFFERKNKPFFKNTKNQLGDPDPTPFILPSLTLTL